MRVTYHNAGLQKGAQIELTIEEASELVREARGDSYSIAAIRLLRDLLPKLEKAILHGDSEAEEGGGG